VTSTSNEPLARVVARNAERRPDGAAFLDGDRRLTWADYAARSDGLAQLLIDLGLEPGERVAVLLPDGAGVHVAFLATEKAGLVAVGIGPRAGRAEIVHLVRKTGASALVSRAAHRDLDVAELVDAMRREGLPIRHHVAAGDDFAPGGSLEVDGAPAALPSARGAEVGAGRALGLDDLWLLNSTSGTTGLPKCVMHHQRRWLAFHELAVEAGELTSADVFMSVVPAPFGFGLWTAHFTPALLGAPVAVLPRFTAEATVAALVRESVTVLAAVSTQFILMLGSPALARGEVQSLRALFTGGEKVPYARAVDFEEKTGARVLQFYGSNETGGLSRTTLRDPRERRLRTAGRTIDAMQVRLFDETGRDVTASGRGRPGCKGPLLSRGYWDDPAANRELVRADGWMLVGDLVSIDGAGYLTVEARVGDFIIRGGKNVSAAEVESLAETHPAVALSAAVAMPDPVFGERVCLYAELRPDAALALAELVAHMEARGASKETLPEHLVVLAELPRSSGGKVAKAALREDAARRAEAARGRE
jgi:acyl-CoA synthetase